MWEVECTEILRVLISDLSDSPTYTDERIERVLMAAALQLINEVSFPTTYTIDILELTISPDPSAATTRDNAFINLLCLKAAVILLNSEARIYSMNSLKITDGPSSIDTTARYSFVKDAAKVLDNQYQQTKVLHQSGQAGAAILTPYTNPNISPIRTFS